MKNISIIVFVFFAFTTVHSQTYFYVDSVSLQPFELSDSSYSKIYISGHLSDLGCSHVSNITYTISNNEIDLVINSDIYDSNACADILVPFDTLFCLDTILSSSQHQINLSGHNTEFILADTSTLNVSSLSSNNVSTILIYDNNIKVETLNNNTNYTLNLTDINGKLILKKRLSAFMEIEINNIKQGVYFVVIQDEISQNIIQSKKFIKK